MHARQVARKWGDQADEAVVLDYSEKAPGSAAGGDSDGDAAAARPEVAAMADLSLKSRIDAEDEEEAEADSHDEGSDLVFQSRMRDDLSG